MTYLHALLYVADAVSTEEIHVSHAQKFCICKTIGFHKYECLNRKQLLFTRHCLSHRSVPSYTSGTMTPTTMTNTGLRQGK